MDFKLLHYRGAVQPKALVTCIWISLLSIIVALTDLTIADEIPDEYVFLKELDPSILQDIRYAGQLNFTFAPLPGYKSAECILHRNAAEALVSAQVEAQKKGFLLKVFDCYRPHKATKAFVDWINKPPSDIFMPEFFPNIPKSALLTQKYISRKSTHSLGFAVDLTLVRTSDKYLQTKSLGTGPCNGPLDKRSLESSLDFGTSFDCFAVQSHTNYGGITAMARQNRKVLLSIMINNGFGNYRREWWHFFLRSIPKDAQIQDFDISDRQANQSTPP